jgi:hypothetical protein
MPRATRSRSRGRTEAKPASEAKLTPKSPKVQYHESLARRLSSGTISMQFLSGRMVPIINSIFVHTFNRLTILSNPELVADFPKICVVVALCCC